MPNAPLSVFWMSARWIPKYGAPNRFSYQLSSLTGYAAIRLPSCQCR